MGRWNFFASMCGWPSLLCGLPLLLLTVTGGRSVSLPGLDERDDPSLGFSGLFAGITVGLNCRYTRKRQWLVLVGVWLAVAGYGWWVAVRHGFD